MTNSRQKGAAFERQIAKSLHAELGIAFKRDLRQYQESAHGDLIPDDDAFPFLIECKAYASGADCRPAWWSQAVTAAEKASKYPAVIYKFNNKPVRVRIGLDAMSEAMGGCTVTHRTAEVDIETFVYLAREIMAARHLRGAA